MSSSRDQYEDRGFDRGRILEWLESVDPHHQPSSELEEVDEGSNFDPEEPPPPPAATACPTPPSQQQQQQQQRQRQQQQQQQIQRLHHLSSFLQRHSNTMTSPQQTDSSPAAARVNTDLPLSQSHTHLHSLHARKKSESPLPEFPVDSELPVFDPKTPTPPGNRATRMSLRSEAIVSRHQPPVLIHARPGLGSVTLSCPVLHVPEMTPSPLISLRSPSPLTSHYQTSPAEPEPKDDRGSKPEEGEEVVPLSSGGKPPPIASLPTSLTAPSHMKDVAQDSKDPHLSPPPPLPHSISSDDQATCVSEPQLQSVLSPLYMTLTEDISPRTAEKLQEKEAVEEELDSLSSVELASLSLKVVDILPQLAVYLGVEYGEYEEILASEPSPQRQSMSILMKWYRSGTGGSRQSLAQALQQFGEHYSQLAQLLLRGELEESRQPPSEEALQTQKLTPSPSPTPLSLPHHPSPSQPPPTHPSPDHKLHTTSSSSPSPSAVLSPQSRRLKAGFTFDEDRCSNDSLPKFLSTRSLFTMSPDSHSSLLVSRGHTPRSQPVQRHLSLSDISSGSTSSWPATPRVGGAQHDSAYSGRRKSSLPHDEQVEMSGRGYNRGRRGSSERAHTSSGCRKSSFHSDEILMSLTEYDRDIPTSASAWRNTERGETIVRMRAGDSGSVDLGGGALPWSEGMKPGDHGPTPHRYRVIGSRSGQGGPLQHRASLGSRELSGLGSWERRELSGSGTSLSRSAGPRTSRGVAGLASASRRAIDRQDSGIETIVSNFSALH